MTEAHESRPRPVSDEKVRQGQSVLREISNEVVRTFKEYYGKGPESAKSYIIDDLLFVVMRGGLNAPEKFLLDQDEADVVRQYRQVFENHMDKILSDKIEKITRRKVIAFQSQVLFDPDMSIEMFIFDDRATEEALDATAYGQIEDEPVGEVAGEEPTVAGGSAERAEDDPAGSSAHGVYRDPK